jgi:hypothetical protein
MLVTTVKLWIVLEENHLNTGHCPVPYMLLISPVTILRQLFALRFAKCNGTSLVFVFRIHIPLLVFWSIRSIAQICNIIPTNFHCCLACTNILPLEPSTSWTVNQNVLLFEIPLLRTYVLKVFLLGVSVVSFSKFLSSVVYLSS